MATVRRTRWAVLTFALAFGSGISVLGNLRIQDLWPFRTDWSLEAGSPPEGGWREAWGAAAESVASAEAAALDQLLWVAGSLALALVAAGAIHLFLALWEDATKRRPEWALRAAVGASRRRLVRERYAELALVGAAGGLAGLLLASLGSWSLERVAPAALVFTGAAAGVFSSVPLLSLLLSLLLASLAPLLSLPTLDLVRRPASWVPRLGGPGTAGQLSGGPGGMSGWLLSAFQVAAGVVLITAAALLVRDPARPSSTDAYANATDTLLMRARLPSGAPSAKTWIGVRRRLLEVRGVEQAAVASPGAFLGLGTVDDVGAECRGCMEAGLPLPVTLGRARHLAVGPGYFRLLGVEPPPVPPGSDGVVVDRTFARQLFPAHEADGRTVWVAGATAIRESGRRVAGVVALPEPVGLDGSRTIPRVLFSTLRHPPVVADVAVRVSGSASPNRLVGYARQAVEELIPGARIEVLGSLESLIEDRRSLVAWLGGFAGVLALLCLATAFGSVTTTLRRRLRDRKAEFAVHRAVGARSRDVARLVLRDAGWLILTGGCVGWSLAASLNRGLPNLIAGLEPLSATTVLGLIAFLGASSFAATWVAGRHLLGGYPARLMDR